MDQPQQNNERIKRLADTLRNNGLAGSESQALEMAKNMVQTDDKVMQQASQNRTSMIKNYDVNKPAAANENPFEQRRPASTMTTSSSWEKEETAQDHPAAPQGPGPSNNQALDQAINNVQQQFQQPTPASRETSPSMTLNETLEEPLETFEAPRAVAPITNETVEEYLNEAPTERELYVPSIEQTEKPLPEDTHTTYLEEEADIPAAPENNQNTPFPVKSVVENPLPMEAPPAPLPERPQEMPVQPPAPERPVEEENQPEKTQEMPVQPPKPERDTSKYAEARISLADVFNVNK